jgi:hypothetical protein
VVGEGRALCEFGGLVELMMVGLGTDCDYYHEA